MQKVGAVFTQVLGHYYRPIVCFVHAFVFLSSQGRSAAPGGAD